MTTKSSTKPYRGGLSKEEVNAATAVPKIFKLSSNENPAGPSPAVIQTIQQSAVTLGEYPSYTDDALREALAELHGRDLTPEHFITGNSGCEVLEIIARTLLGSDTTFINCPPTFPVYQLTATREGAEAITVPLDPENFTYDFEAIINHVAENTRVLYLSAPNNPTGTMLKAGDLTQLLDALPAHVTVVFDEVYYHFVDEAVRLDAIQHVLDGRNFIILHSFSKAYGLAGMRLGYGIANPVLAQKLSSVRRPFHLNQLALAAGLAAVADQEHVDKSVQLTIKGREWIMQELQALGVKTWPSQGNFIMFETPGSAEDFTQELLAYGIMVRPAFGLDNCIRVSMGLEEGNQAFIQAMKAIITK